MTVTQPRYVLAPSESVFFQRLNAVPEWRVFPDDPPEIVHRKISAKMKFFYELYEGVQCEAFRKLEMILSDHVRVIDGELIWEAKLSGDKQKEDVLTYERTGIVKFFEQFADLPKLLVGLRSQLDALDIPVNPELHSPEGQDHPDLG